MVKNNCFLMAINTWETTTNLFGNSGCTFLRGSLLRKIESAVFPLVIEAPALSPRSCPDPRILFHFHITCLFSGSQKPVKVVIFYAKKTRKRRARRCIEWGIFWKNGEKGVHFLSISATFPSIEGPPDEGLGCFLCPPKWCKSTTLRKPLSRLSNFSGS